MNQHPGLISSADDPTCRALEENLWDFWRMFGVAAGSHLLDEDGAVWFDTPIPKLPYNGVIRFTGRDNVEARIDRIFDHYAARDLPFMWIVHPTSAPEDLAERLTKRGLPEVELCSGMAMKLDDLPPVTPAPKGVEIREVIDKADMDATIDMIAWRWEVPPEIAPRLRAIVRSGDVGSPGSMVRCWMAWLDGMPVSKAVMILAAGVAGIYGVVTKPEARGMGLARILTLEALEKARRAGVTQAVLHSSPMALRLYEKIGFRTIAPFRIHAPPEGLHI